jgi:cob(I)alamin adenosyltransferase
MTSLLSGERVAKTHARVEACGEVDELASVLGALAAALPPAEPSVRATVIGIQAELMRAGALLATSGDSPTLAQLPLVGPEQTRTLEKETDALEAGMPQLQTFILPGGHPSAAWAHVARTVCRRAERRVLGVMAGSAGGAPTSPTAGSAGVAPDSPMAGILAYLNRLSTYLFVLARHCNMVNGIAEVPWQG